MQGAAQALVSEASIEVPISASKLARSNERDELAFSLLQRSAWPARKQKHGIDLQVCPGTNIQEYSKCLLKSIASVADLAIVKMSCLIFLYLLGSPWRDQQSIGDSEE